MSHRSYQSSPQKSRIGCNDTRRHYRLEFKRTEKVGWNERKLLNFLGPTGLDYKAVWLWTCAVLQEKRRRTPRIFRDHLGGHFTRPDGFQPNSCCSPSESGVQIFKPKTTVFEPYGWMEFALLCLGLTWNLSLVSFSPFFFFWNGNIYPLPAPSLLVFWNIIDFYI